MLLGRISRVYFVILVVWLVKKVRFEESFELFRGHYDVFSNTKYSQTEGSGDFEASSYFEASADPYHRSYPKCSPHWRQEYEANCKDMSCSYCICNLRNDKRYTYIGNDHGDGRCVSDKEVLSESGLFTSSR